MRWYVWLLVFCSVTDEKKMDKCLAFYRVEGSGMHASGSLSDRLVTFPFVRILH